MDSFVNMLALYTGGGLKSSGFPTLNFLRSALPAYLLVPQSHHRVDFRGAAGGQVAGEEGHE